MTPQTLFAEVDQLEAPAVHRRPKAGGRRELRDIRRAANCAAAVGELDRETEIYGFTRGQFSLVDLINHCLDQTGPGFLTISTWAAGEADVSAVLGLIESGRLTGARWLVDRTFGRRAPELVSRIRKAFGPEAIRIADNHAKFFLLEAAGWQLVCRTSMNLNHNPRFESFQLAHDPELFAFHKAIIDELWRS